MTPRGKREVASDLQNGTTVSLIFPAARLDEGAGCKPSLAPRRSEALRILVVDDDLLLLKSLRDTLEAEGHEVVVADGGQAGIDRLSELREALANLTGS
jgi:PleD family two-component response regulator